MGFTRSIEKRCSASFDVQRKGRERCRIPPFPFLCSAAVLHELIGEIGFSCKSLRSGAIW